MSEINENQFITLDDAKKRFGFTSTLNDDILLSIVKSSNNEVKKLIVGVVDDIASIEGSKFFPRCKDTALIFCEAEIKRQINHMYDEYEKIIKVFNSMMDSLLEDMKAIAPVRTSREVVSREVDFEDEFVANRRFV